MFCSLGASMCWIPVNIGLNKYTVLLCKPPHVMPESVIARLCVWECQHKQQWSVWSQGRNVILLSKVFISDHCHGRLMFGFFVTVSFGLCCGYNMACEIFGKDVWKKVHVIRTLWLFYSTAWEHFVAKCRICWNEWKVWICQVSVVILLERWSIVGLIQFVVEISWMCYDCSLTQHEVIMLQIYVAPIIVKSEVRFFECLINARGQQCWTFDRQDYLWSFWICHYAYKNWESDKRKQLCYFLCPRRKV